MPKVPKMTNSHLQHLKERARDEVDCSHADKHQNFHQVDTVIFVGCGQACPKHSK